MPPELWIHLAVVACGNRLEETLVMLKSAVLFSHRKMRFHIFTEEALKPEFDKQVKQDKPRHSVYGRAMSPQWTSCKCSSRLGLAACSVVGAWILGSGSSFTFECVIQRWAGEMARFLMDLLSMRARVWVSMNHHSMCL